MGRNEQWTRIPVVWEDNKLKAPTKYKKFQINKSHIVKKYTNEYYQNEDLYGASEKFLAKLRDSPP